MVDATMSALGRPRRAYLEVVVSAYLLLASEWLFQVTKPSFMSVLTWAESLRVLLVSPLYLVVPALVVQAGLLVLHGSSSRLVGRRLPSPAALIPAALYSVTVLLLVDNFVYTVFGVGIVSLAGVSRYALAAPWAGLFGVIVWMRTRHIVGDGGATPGSRVATVVALAVLAVGVLLAGWESTTASPSAEVSIDRDGDGEARLPDIFLISMDAVPADHSSLYGYERATTPFLDTFARDALVFENAFSNNCVTTGALIGLLSGKRSTDFRVFYPPMTLQGAHTHQHLPAILRKLGYRNGQVTVRYWASALWQGMRNAFDSVNRYDTGRQELRLLPTPLADRLRSQRYFLIETHSRVIDRVLHLWGVRDMVNYMDLVKEVTPKTYMDDMQRRDAFIEFLEKHPHDPVFVQLHFMTGHGPKYHVPAEYRHFTRADDKGPWNPNSQDDAIRMMDALFGDVIGWLEREKRLDDALIVVTSDHLPRWKTEGRIPFVIRFPGGSPRGSVSTNVQLADVAPTVLDYLGIAQPAWMTGQSLLDEAALDRQRPIISAAVVDRDLFTMPTPPLYGLQVVSAVICDRWYRLDLDDNSLTSGAVDGHTDGCSAEEAPTHDTVERMLRRHLEERGYGLQPR